MATQRLSKEFQDILTLVSAAVAAGIDLIQLREKQLTSRTLYELTAAAAEITHESATALLVNDRADIARGAGADGVHLTSNSIDAAVIRRTFGDDLLIGVSTHSQAEVERARDAKADFAVFGPVFETGSKMQYGHPVGIKGLGEATIAGSPFPVMALGGISTANAAECLRAGAAGVAGISLFAEPSSLQSTVAAIRRRE
ncbi:MAG: thiamine-phosphate pyrophosphorylase [Blastocatellia bacterium]|nr:thiamine-phosphate pyrophosphorylase [Blastocatellia bacterium]